MVAARVNMSVYARVGVDTTSDKQVVLGSISPQVTAQELGPASVGPGRRATYGIARCEQDIGDTQSHR